MYAVADTGQFGGGDASSICSEPNASQAGEILKGGLGGPCPPPRFLLGAPFGPQCFFLNFPFRFVWLTYVGLPNAFCKNTGHFVNSA